MIANIYKLDILIMRFNKKILILFTFVVTIVFQAQAGNEPDKESKEAFVFKKKIEATDVKDQYRTNTCWSFSTISFLESELYRETGEFVDLSEMFVVRKVYVEKAKRYVRMHGNINFAPGGEPNDVANVLKRYGLMPESAYSGLKVDPHKHIQTEMDEVLKDYVNAIVKNPNRKLSNVWLEGFEAILDSYLGKLPEKFVVDGVEYDAKSYAASLPLKADDYVMISSFMYKPYYTPFVLEIPDNWSWGKSYNVPLDELVSITDYAITKGYSTTWSADISEKGFNFKSGTAVAPRMLYLPQSEEEKKLIFSKSKNELTDLFFSNKDSKDEVVVTEELRQASFDNYSTEDDHGMHILGLATDTNNKEYYYVKNSWGQDNPYNGYLYVSKSYFKYKTIAIMLHKDAIPKEIRHKLDI